MTATRANTPFPFHLVLYGFSFRRISTLLFESIVVRLGVQNPM
jgi:hypothetical protein